MTRSSVIPTRRSRWPLAYGLLLMLVGISIMSAALQALFSQPDQQAAMQGFDEGYAAAMNQVADTVGAAYSTGYRAAQREASATCGSPRQGAPL